MFAIVIFLLNSRAKFGGGLADGQVLIDDQPVFIGDAPCVVTEE